MVSLYSPLVDHVTVYAPDRLGGRCGVPFCPAWLEYGHKHGLCDFHEKLANRQAGEPFTGDTDDREAYKAHVSRTLSQIPYHMILAVLWPGPFLESKVKALKREKSLKERWQEEGDR